MITPLLTQLTYEGLVDELIGIKNCMHNRSLLLMTGAHISFIFYTAHVELPVSLLTPPAAPNPAAASASTSTAPTSASSLTKVKKKKHLLTPATDPLFAELRDLNFSAVGKKLNHVARRLDEDYKVCLHQENSRLPF